LNTRRETNSEKKNFGAKKEREEKRGSEAKKVPKAKQMVKKKRVRGGGPKGYIRIEEKRPESGKTKRRLGQSYTRSTNKRKKSNQNADL